MQIQQIHCLSRFMEASILELIRARQKEAVMPCWALKHIFLFLKVELNLIYWLVRIYTKIANKVTKNKILYFKYLILYEIKKGKGQNVKKNMCANKLFTMVKHLNSDFWWEMMQTTSVSYKAACTTLFLHFFVPLR